MTDAGIVLAKLTASMSVSVLSHSVVDVRANAAIVRLDADTSVSPSAMA